MTTEVEVGLGSEFWLADASATLVLLGEVVAVPIPSGTSALIDASHMKTVGFRDYIASPLEDGEEAELTMNWIPGDATEALCLEAKNKRRAFKVIVPAEGGDRQFTGTVLVRNYVRNNPMDDKRTASLTVKWVSAIVEADVA